MQVLEHPFAMLDLAPAQPARIGTVQSRRMALETHVVELGQPRLVFRTAAAQCEADDHEDDDTNKA